MTARPEVGGVLEEGAPLPPARGLGSAVSWISSGHFSKFSDLFCLSNFSLKFRGVFKHPKHPPSYGLGYTIQLQGL